VELMETRAKNELLENFSQNIASIIGSGINGNIQPISKESLLLLIIASIIGSGINGNLQQDQVI